MNVYFTIKTKHQWLRWAPLVYFLIAGYGSLIAMNIRCTTEASNTSLLSVISGEYLTILVVHIILFRSESWDFHRMVLTTYVMWNIWIFCAIWASTVTALVLYLMGKVDFISSLWVSVRKTILTCLTAYVDRPFSMYFVGCMDFMETVSVISEISQPEHIC
jgi:hypothetical protein